MIPRLNMHFPFWKLFSLCKSDKNIETNFPNNVFFLNNARTGLSLTLQALNLPPRTKIGVMMYNCHTVMNAVYQSGYEIVFFDVNSNLLIDKTDLINKIESVSVLIISHLFGIVNDINKIKAEKPELIVIEDCAHAFLSRTPDGDLAGSMGDIAIYSTGLGKFPSISNGGVVVVNNPDFVVPVAKLVNNLPKPKLKDEIAVLLKGLIFSALYHETVYGWFTQKIKRKFTDINVKKIESHQKMSSITFNLFIKEKCHLEKYRDLQQNNARLITELLKDQVGVYPIYKDMFEYSNCFMFPVWCDDKELLIQKMKKNKLEVATHFEASLNWAKEFGNPEKNKYNTEEVINHVVMIPCHYKLTKKKLLKHFK